MTFWQRLKTPGYLRFRAKVWAVRCAVVLFGVPSVALCAVGLPLYLGIASLMKKRSEAKMLQIVGGLR